MPVKITLEGFTTVSKWATVEAAATFPQRENATVTAWPAIEPETTSRPAERREWGMSMAWRTASSSSGIADKIKIIITLHNIHYAH
jgi:hypothetical protein